VTKKIGFLVSATRTTWKKYTDAFEGELKGKKWTIDHTGTAVGPNVVFIDYKPKVDAAGKAVDGAAGDPTLIGATAALFADPSYDVIVTAGEFAAEACHNATKTTPIVIASAGDLSKFAGTNVTGFTNGQADDQTHQILNERIARMVGLLVPKKAVAVVGNSNVAPVKAAMDYAVGQNMGVPVYKACFTAADFTSDATIQGKLTPRPPNAPPGTPTADVVLVCSDPLMRTNGDAFVRAAHNMPARRMNTMHEFAEWHDEHKGDLCFGPDFKTLFQSAADYVDLIIGPKKTPVTALPIVPAKLKDCKQTPSAFHRR
jgi:hypothetical protein